ncbi:TetR/AcrR family transcriptional regulator [Isoptericola hypogeus]|uniref:TetR/AcrR family transcriptional regulator n=1 Tax=Isoptericola hypogeus TaxID=300179 RepID=A0ABP4VPJ2_9MICO
MPRLVDHDVRRRQITDASRRVVARDGLEAATFQAVAAEAGVSVRLVQYYFGNKQGLLEATHRAVIEDAAARFGPAGQAEPAAPREVLRGILLALLPLDDAQRADAVVLAAFHAAAVTRSGIGPDALLGAPRVLVDVVAHQFARADGATDGSAAGSGRRLDAEIVLAAASGLTQGMVGGHHSRETALAVADRLLDRVLGPIGASS